MQGYKKHTWLHRFIDFKNWLNTFEYFNTRVDSTHIYKIINEI